MDEKKRMKMAIIAGASHAIKFKQNNPMATEDQILQHISREAGSILNNMDDED